MQLKEFYESVLPAEGRYVLFQNRRNDFFPTLEALIAATERRIDSQGLYFATASYGDKFKVDDFGREIPVRTQENVVALKALRVDIDAGEEKFAKHPNGAYPTQRDALKATIDFIKATGLIPTLIVSSGEGLHVYWCLTEPVDPEPWREASVLLNAVGRTNGLKIDAGCTADSARVLRPVGSPHKNGSRVAVLKATGKVWAFDELRALLGTFQEAAEEAFALPAPRLPKVHNINDDVLATTSPPSSLARVAEHCSAVGLMRDKEGCIPEPMWRAVLGVAKYCEDGEELAHEWSSGYDGYNARETQEKLDRWETPPTTCAHFQPMHDGCATCQYRGKITTPKQLGYISIAPAEPAPIPDAVQSTASAVPETSAASGELGSGMALPDEPASADCPVPERPDLFDDESPFFYKVVDNRWTLFHKFKTATKDATGQTVYVEHTKPVAYKLFWIDSNSLPGATDTGGVMLQFGRVERPGFSRQDRMDMPAGVSADIKALCKWLADQGINLAPRSVNKDAADHVFEYVARERIRSQNDMRFVIKDRFGYHFHEDKFICSMGQYTVYPDGTILKTICNSKLKGVASSLLTQALPENASGKWDPSCWRTVAPHVAEYVAFLRKHYGREGFENARLALAINLASPYLVFAADSLFNDAEDLPASGFMLSMYSEGSGIGKSSLMAAIAAAYGKDTLARKGNDASITAVAAATTAKNTAIYPFLLDEVTQNEASKAAAMIDTFANGNGRLRAKSDGSVSKSAETWALVSTVATNVPQRELLTAAQKRSDALLMRLLELNFDEIPKTGDREAFAADLKNVQLHCGAFGLFQALLAVRTGHLKLAEMTAANVTEAYKLLDVDQQYRFYARMLGAMMTNHQLLGRWSPFDLDELVETFKRAIKDTIWYVTANRRSPEGELASMLADLSPSIAVTKTWTRRGGRADEQGHDVLLNANVRHPLMGREVQEWGMVLVDASAVRIWCLNQQTSVAALIKKLDAAGLLVREDGKDKIKQRLTTGIMGIPTVNGYYYKFRTRPAEASGDGSNVIALHAGDGEKVPLQEAAATA